MRPLISLFFVFLSLNSIGQENTHQNEIVFRFDTARSFQEISKIKHTTYSSNKKKSVFKIDVENNGLVGYTGPNKDPNSPAFLLYKSFDPLDTLLLIREKVDSIDRTLELIYHSLPESNDSTKYLYTYSGSGKRPSTLKEYLYANGSTTPLIVEDITLQYLHNEIVVVYPPDGEDDIVLHYLYNNYGNLIKLYGENICDGCVLLFGDSLGGFFEIGKTPITYHYEYDKKGRMIAMYETTGGKKELLFTRKYFPK